MALLDVVLATYTEPRSPGAEAIGVGGESLTNMKVFQRSVWSCKFNFFVIFALIAYVPPIRHK